MNPKGHALKQLIAPVGETEKLAAQASVDRSLKEELTLRAGHHNSVRRDRKSSAKR